MLTHVTALINLEDIRLNEAEEQQIDLRVHLGEVRCLEYSGV